MSERTLIIVESPYNESGGFKSVEKNEAFARLVCRKLIDEGYVPFASHLFYPQMLNEDSARERSEGIQCGLAWAMKAEEVHFCLPDGFDFTPGMVKALKFYLQSFPRPKKIRITTWSFDISNGKIDSVDCITEIIVWEASDND